MKVYFSYKIIIFGKEEEHKFDTMAELRKDAQKLYGNPYVKFLHLVSKNLCRRVEEDPEDEELSLSDLFSIDDDSLFDDMEDTETQIDNNKEIVEKETSKDTLLDDIDKFFSEEL